MANINYERLQGKLNILADAAKYDVSCSSSAGTRKNQGGALGDASATGICHSYTEDGRCVSLLKILLSATGAQAGLPCALVRLDFVTPSRKR